jgi:hypothetical protein
MAAYPLDQVRPAEQQASLRAAEQLVAARCHERRPRLKGARRVRLGRQQRMGGQEP